MHVVLRAQIWIVAPLYDKYKLHGYLRTCCLNGKMIFRMSSSRTRMNARPRGCCVNKVYGVFGWRKACMVFVFSTSIGFLLSVYTLRVNQVKGRDWQPTGPVQTKHASTPRRKPVQSHRDWAVAVGGSVGTRWCRYKKQNKGKGATLFFPSM